MAVICELCLHWRVRASQTLWPLLIAAELKQWKTNISSDDKTRHEPQTRTSHLVNLWRDLFFTAHPPPPNAHHSHQFLHRRPPRLSRFLTSEASNGGGDSNRSLLFIVRIKGNIPCVEGTGWNSCTVHGVSWANAVASLQTVWLHPPSRWDSLNGCDGVFFSFFLCRVKGRTTLDEFLSLQYLSAWLSFWLTRPEHSNVPPEYDKRKLAQCQPTQPLKPLISWGFDLNSVLFPTNSWKDNVGLLVKNTNKKKTTQRYKSFWCYPLSRCSKTTQCFYTHTWDCA